MGIGSCASSGCGTSDEVIEALEFVSSDIGQNIANTLQFYTPNVHPHGIDFAIAFTKQAAGELPEVYGFRTLSSNWMRCSDEAPSSACFARCTTSTPSGTGVR